jgi:hypothetical protein
MKKVLLVLVLGLAMMSCSKEDIVVPCEGGHIVTSLLEGEGVYHIGYTNEDGVFEWVEVEVEEYDVIAAEYHTGATVCYFK